MRPEPLRLAYGDDLSQWLELHRPEGPSRGLVVVVHGGFWKARYDASYAAPLAADLAARGWTAALVEYRRVGDSAGGDGGWPTTCDDVSAAINRAVAEADGPDVVVALGHSAGGHLAAWSAARTRFFRWASSELVTHVVSLAGVLDLTAALRDGLGSGAVLAFMGADSGEASYDEADPRRHLPLAAPVWAVHARDDEDVPFSQSADYVGAATAAGGRATLVEVAGGHFGLVDVTNPAWAAVVEVLDSIS